ncbi:uncharacterized protein SPSK_10660 [Sporothrix schenckii 1099-18]|uniref:Uncharacterized protein n=1 Tax=Sporothrix schenckii 1099-18 TaxID=1397361 RepID=A0A0F2LVC4_SPOSC|nr:uncharacterized protein SPSK_10660 [Sporothrix schenckii 1099-18]KJR80794.1 hypothetical protein SPSK_10660 [Sporothrix schenckii 1099-18]
MLRKLRRKQKQDAGRHNQRQEKEEMEHGERRSKGRPRKTGITTAARRIDFSTSPTLTLQRCHGDFHLHLISKLAPHAPPHATWPGQARFLFTTTESREDTCPKCAMKDANYNGLKNVLRPGLELGATAAEVDGNEM